MTGKNTLSLVLAFACVFSLLSGCGAENTESQPTLNTTETTTAPTTVPETTAVPTTVPETAAPTEPPVTGLSPEELEERVNQELLVQKLPYEMEIVHGYSYDRMTGILHPTGEGDLLKYLRIDLVFDMDTNAVTRIDMYFPYLSSEEYEHPTQEQQSMFMQFGAAISKAYDPMCSDEALSAMINVSCTDLTEISEQYENRQEIFNDVILDYGTNITSTLYNNKAEGVCHDITSYYDGDSLSALSYDVYSTVDQVSQVVSVSKDVSAYITIAELESLLNEKFTELGLPLELSFKEYIRYHYGNIPGDFHSEISYTGEYADVETNKLIRNFKSLFYITLDATGVSRDSYIRSIDFSISSYYLEEFHASGSEYIDLLTDAFTEIAFTIASALDDQLPEDMLEQLSSVTPYHTAEYTNDGVTSSDRSKVFSGLFCKKNEHADSDLAYSSISYTFRVIDLMSEEFDPHIPHGDEINDPQYLEYKIEFGFPAMGDDYISFMMNESYRTVEDVWEFCHGTYSPFELDCWFSEGVTFELYGFIFNQFEYSTPVLSGELDYEHYAVCQYFGDVYKVATEIYAYYNTNYEEYFPQEYLNSGLEPEYVLRVPMGISLILDEEMTPEELSQFHTDKMEPTDTWRDYQVTVYCPRDVMHIQLRNPDTGGHQYWVLEKTRFDELYGDLTVFLDEKAESEFYVDP